MTNSNPTAGVRAVVARPIAEPLTRPQRSLGSTRHRVGVTLDHDRYVALRTFAAMHRLSADDVAVIAIDRLVIGH